MELISLYKFCHLILKDFLRGEEPYAGLLKHVLINYSLSYFKR